MRIGGIGLRMLPLRQIERESGADERMSGLGIGIRGKYPAFMTLVPQRIHQVSQVELDVGLFEALKDLHRRRPAHCHWHACLLRRCVLSDWELIRCRLRLTCLRRHRLYGGLQPNAPRALASRLPNAQNGGHSEDELRSQDAHAEKVLLSTMTQKAFFRNHQREGCLEKVIRFHY